MASGKDVTSSPNLLFTLSFETDLWSLNVSCLLSTRDDMSPRRSMKPRSKPEASDFAPSVSCQPECKVNNSFVNWIRVKTTVVCPLTLRSIFS